jgi:ketosteroid isomerase-like protein
MSQENVEVVRRLNSLFNAGDIDAVFRLMHPDVQLRDLQNAPDLPETVRGRDAVRHVLAQWTGAYDDYTGEALDYVDADPWVIVDVRWCGTGKRSGLQVDLRIADAWRIEDGTVVEGVVGYADVPTALKAVALEE